MLKHIKLNIHLELSIYDEVCEVIVEQKKLLLMNLMIKRITVFGKLPKVNIPTAHGRHYNPHFGYVIEY